MQMNLFPAADLIDRELQAKAIAAAQRGDWEPADELELAYLNHPACPIVPHDRRTGRELGARKSHARPSRAIKIVRTDAGLQVKWRIELLHGSRIVHTDIDGRLIGEGQ